MERDGERKQRDKEREGEKEGKEGENEREEGKDREGRTEKEREYERLAHYVGWCEQRQQRDF